MSKITENKLILKILRDLKEKESVHARFGKKGVLYIDRPLPFLVVYRIPANGKDLFTMKLGRTESSYLMGEESDPVQELCECLGRELSDRFSSFLLLEVWVNEEETGQADTREDFRVHFSHSFARPIAEKLQQELNSIRIGRRLLEASLKEVAEVAPPGKRPLLDKRQAKRSESMLIGLEISPIYMNPLTGKSYPLFLRELRKAFSTALKKTFLEFVHLHTSHNASHFQMLGKTVIEDIVWEIDQKLAECTRLFNFLFLVSPVNQKEAWESFVENNFRKPPIFHYRPMPIDPELIKRQLYNLPIEEISDPTIAFLFRDKRKEIDRMMNMMIDREKPDFLHSSLQVFGRLEENLVEVARALLVAIPPQDPAQKDDQAQRQLLSAEEFAAMAREELLYLQRQYPEVSREVHIRDDIDGVMVSQGILWISSNFSVSRRRAPGLIQHEVGTHIVSYYNGRAQPFQLFCTGVPGYEQLQEGLAVLAEYLMDGLSNQRMRVLAARVVAVDHMVKGHSFVDTFGLLKDKYRFSPWTAFSITTRVYRGGGLTKDAVYLKGFLNLLDYLRKGKDVFPLLIGKIREDYLPIVQELLHRKLLRPIPIRPRYLEKKYRPRLEALKGGASIFNMIRE